MGFVAIALLLHWYFLGIRFQRRIRFQREIRFQRGIFWLLIVLTQIYVDVLLIRYFMVLFNQELIRIQIILAKEFINFLDFIVFKMKSFRLVMMSASFYGFVLKFFTYTLWNLLHVNIWKIFVWLFASWSTSGMLWASATFPLYPQLFSIIAWHNLQSWKLWNLHCINKTIISIARVTIFWLIWLVRSKGLFWAIWKTIIRSKFNDIVWRLYALLDLNYPWIVLFFQYWIPGLEKVCPVSRIKWELLRINLFSCFHLWGYSICKTS